MNNPCKEVPYDGGPMVTARQMLGKTVLVLAGNQHQYKDFCERYRLEYRNPSVTRYIRDITTVTGLMGEYFVYVKTGTYYERRDSIEIENYLRQREIKEIV